MKCKSKIMLGTAGWLYWCGEYKHAYNLLGRVAQLVKEAPDGERKKAN